MAMPLDFVAEVSALAVRGSASSKAKSRMRSTPCARENRFLHNEFALVPGNIRPPIDGILALGVLPHDEEVDVARLAAGKRRADARHKPDRPQVHILVELAAELQQRAPQRDVVGHFAGQPTAPKKIASCPPILSFQSSGIMRRALVIVAGREVEMIELELEAESRRPRPERARLPA